MSVFWKSVSPKTPPRDTSGDVNKILDKACQKLQKVALKRNRDEFVEIINNPSNQTKERKEMTKEKLYELGAIPKLAFCRLENFRILRLLGIGTYGKVFLVRMKTHRLIPDDLYPHFFPQYPNKVHGPIPKKLPDGLPEHADLCTKYWLPPSDLYPEDDKFMNYFAMKVVPKHRVANQKNDIFHLQTELRALKKVDHPFIVRLVSSFQTKQKVFFIMEYYPGGDLFNLMENTYRLSELAVRFYLTEVLLAIEYLHSINIIYRDLKPENVVLDNEGHCRLVDMGLSRDQVAPFENKCMTRCGTVNYMAPEVHRYLGHGRAADFWSLGALAYDMLCVDYPVQSLAHQDPVKFPYFLSAHVISLLNGLLTKDPQKRLGALKISEEFDSPYGGPDEIKSHPFFLGINWADVYTKKQRPPWRPRVECPMDGPAYFADGHYPYPSISYCTKYDIDHDKQTHFESFNFVNPRFFEGSKYFDDF